MIELIGILSELHKTFAVSTISDDIFPGLQTRVIKQRGGHEGRLDRKKQASVGESDRPAEVSQRF